MYLYIYINVILCFTFRALDADPNPYCAKLQKIKEFMKVEDLPATLVEETLGNVNYAHRCFTVIRKRKKKSIRKRECFLMSHFDLNIQIMFFFFFLRMHLTIAMRTTDLEIAI